MAIADLSLTIETPAGEFIARYSASGLCELNFPKSRLASARKTDDENDASPQIRKWHKLTTRALHDALAGRTPKEFPPLDLSRGTDFQRKVWEVMLRIDCGKTKSYAEVATAIGKPNATRAVGNACGANPIPVLVPCHRVLAANQRIGGFTSGLDWKRKLLAIERTDYFDDLG